jgi:acyl carrier protein
MTPRPIIREFVGQHLNGLDLADDADIFATGYVSSLFAVQLVMFVESRFGVQVSGVDLDIDNFRTIDAIEGFVRRKLAAEPASQVSSSTTALRTAASS